MSLKAFHIVFITLSTVLAFGFAVWCFRDYSAHAGGTQDLVLGIGSAIAGVALIIYGIYFLKKLKHISMV